MLLEGGLWEVYICKFLLFLTCSCPSSFSKVISLEYIWMPTISNFPFNNNNNNNNRETLVLQNTVHIAKLLLLPRIPSPPQVSANRPRTISPRVPSKGLAGATTTAITTTGGVLSSPLTRRVPLPRRIQPTQYQQHPRRRSSRRKVVVMTH